jgi:hypothetical protein
MPYGPNDNPTKISKELQDKILSAPSAEHIAQYLREAAVKQGLAQTDEFNPEHYTPTARAEAPQPQRFAETLTVDGQKYILESDSEHGLAQKEIEFYRSLQHQQTTTTTEVARDDKGRFRADHRRADENAFQRAELELKFKRGEISTEEYLTESGAIESYLEQQGVPLDELRTTVQEKRQVKMHAQSWAEAVENFKNGPGADWPGGPELLKEAGNRLIALGLENAPDKVAALTQVWNSIKSENEGLKKIEEAHTPEQIRDAAVAMRGGDSSIWGR